MLLPRTFLGPWNSTATPRHTPAVAYTPVASPAMMPASMPGDTAQPAYQRAGQGLAAGALGVGSLPTATPAINPSEVDVEQAGLPQSFKGGAGVPDEELQGKTLSHLVTHVTVLSYIALVLILVGGATDNWWRVRRTGEGPQVDKRGFWHTCASDGSCKSENPSDERPYVVRGGAREGRGGQRALERDPLSWTR